MSPRRALKEGKAAMSDGSGAHGEVSVRSYQERKQVMVEGPTRGIRGTWE